MTMNALHNMKTMATYLAKGPSCNQTNGYPDGGRNFSWSDQIKVTRAARMTRGRGKGVAKPA